MTAFEVWCLGVIRGVGEPLTQVSVDTHWAWANAETAPYDLMRWNNPQNTTEPWAGALDSGAQPGLHDVKIYRTLQDGIDATCWTLLNEPYYGAIVANLRAGLPRQAWGVYSQAAAELHAWGTGSAWLNAAPYFGSAPILFSAHNGGSEDSDMALLPHPTQPGRLDLVYVGTDLAVHHAYGFSLTQLEANPNFESWGGASEPGSLTAAWTADGQQLYISVAGPGGAAVYVKVINIDGSTAQDWHQIPGVAVAVKPVVSSPDDDSAYATKADLKAAIAALPKPPTTGTILGPIGVTFS